MPQKPPTASPLLHANGLHGRTGAPLLPPLSAHQIAEVARGRPMPRQEVGDLEAWLHAQKARREAKEGVDPEKLEEAGWGVVFPADADIAALRDALRPLLDHRCAQAAGRHEHLYREFTGGDGVLPGDSKRGWLARHGAGPGPVDPDKVPYYLLLVGGPEEIPFRFQYQLDVQHAVGRLHFDTLEEYARYAEGVVAAETGRVARPRRAAFFATAEPGDPATQASSEHLVRPLVADLERKLTDWEIETAVAEEATRSRLGCLLGDGGEAPGLLFTASHGLGFDPDDPLLREHQGALVCQARPGAGGEMPRRRYFAGEDLADGAGVAGMLVFCFACYGAGTPRWDDFTRAPSGERRQVAGQPFVARLPQRLLAHPRGGALAVVGHVERAWGYSFLWEEGERWITTCTTFESTLEALLGGARAGRAFEHFNRRYAELATELSELVEDLDFGTKLDEIYLSWLWTATHDARNYVILGDPAVRLAIHPDP